MKKTYTIVLMLLMSMIAHAQQLPKAPIPGGVESPDRGLSREIEALHHQMQHDLSYTPIPKITRNSKSEYQLGIQDRPDTACVQIIPVVFHVFHPKGEAGVPLSQLEYAIEDLNRTFAGADADYGTVNSVFGNDKSYSKIRFTLAKKDQFGKPTNGVVYYQDRQGGFGNIGPSWENQIRTYAWDNYKYFNVYVQNDLYANSVFNNSGVCWYPSTWMSDNNIARMVYNYVYLGKGGSSYNYLEFNQTFTHEAGHYLDLRHTFEGNSCSGPGDLCDDTPPTDIASAGCDATRCNGLINGENYMDYNTTCYKNFTIDQVSRMDAAMNHPARSTLWQPSNLVATGVISPNTVDTCFKSPFISYSTQYLKESLINDGSIENDTVIIYASSGAKFGNKGAALIPGDHYTPIELPEGLREEIIVSEDGTYATMTISGKAIKHAANDSKSSLTFTFFDEAFSEGVDKAIVNISPQFRIEFRDPWKKTCVDTYVRASADTTWNLFELQGPFPRFYGMWKNDSIYALENYGRGIITESVNSANIVFIEPGAVIDSKNTWNQGGAKQIVLHSPNYTVLDGKTGYVGFRIQVGNDFHYGWMRIAISATGCTLLEYQYNEKPNEGIVAGAECAIALSTEEDIIADSFSIKPNPTNGSIMIDFKNDMPRGGSFVISSLTGIEMKRFSIEQSLQEISLVDLSSGMYVISLFDYAGNMIRSQSIIKY
jgi:hypothetical protein